MDCEQQAKTSSHQVISRRPKRNILSATRNCFLSTEADHNRRQNRRNEHWQPEVCLLALPARMAASILSSVASKRSRRAVISLVSKSAPVLTLPNLPSVGTIASVPTHFWYSGGGVSLAVACLFLGQTCDHTFTFSQGRRVRQAIEGSRERRSAHSDMAMLIECAETVCRLGCA